MNVIPLTFYQQELLFFLSFFILSAYYIQYNNTISLVQNKKDIFNKDIIYSEINFMLKNPSSAKIYFFPALWALIFTSTFIQIFFYKIGSKWIFHILAIALFIQDYIHYNFIIKTALEIENNPKKSIEDVLKENEWIVTREKADKKILQTLRKANDKELKEFGFKIDKDSEYYLNDTKDIYELYGNNFDKLHILLSPMFNQMYQPYELNKKLLISFLESVFVIISLYLALIIN